MILSSSQKPVVIFVLSMMLLARLASAEQAKISRIGYLAGTSAVGDLPRFEAFRKGLRALGHVEGQDIVIESRYTEGKFDQLTELATELVRLKVDIIVAVNTIAALAAKSATKTMPIFFFGVIDPVAAGLVDSLARPGGNITGLTNVASVLSAKRLELLKETMPKLSRVAVLWDPQSPGSTPQWNESQLAAKELGLQVHSMAVSSAGNYEGAFKEAVQARSAALAVTLNPLSNVNQKQVVELAQKNRLPAIYGRAEFVDAGGLMSYGTIFATQGTDAARLVDKILKGTKPTDLPVEQPTKFELVINLKTAKALGLTIPPLVLMRAEKVIK